MSAAEALGAARAAGIDVVLDGNELLLEARREPAQALIDEVSRHKASIIELLLLPDANPRLTNAKLNDILDRWSQKLAGVAPDRPPLSMPEAQWREFINDAHELLENGWVANAMIMNWGPHDLFGCHRRYPSWISYLGLAGFIRGGGITEMTPDTAVIKMQGGGSCTYYCGGRQPEQMLLWQLAAANDNDISGRSELECA